MNITELHDRSARLEAELRETRELLARATHDPGALAEELAQTRTYAFSANADPMETAISGCADSLRRYGYCVIDNVIPGEEVETIRDEIVAADVRIKGNIAAINAFFEDKPELAGLTLEWSRFPQEEGQYTGVRIASDPQGLLMALLALEEPLDSVGEELVKEFIRRPEHRFVLGSAWPGVRAGVVNPGPAYSLLGEVLGTP